MNLSQLAESDARREGAQHTERHHAALIASIVRRIWQDKTRTGPSVRQRPPRFSNITETVTVAGSDCSYQSRVVELPVWLYISIYNIVSDRSQYLLP